MSGIIIILFVIICTISESAIVPEITTSDVFKSLCLYPATNPTFCKNVPTYPDRSLSKKAVLIPLREGTDIDQQILLIEQNEFFPENGKKQYTYDEWTSRPPSIWDWMNSDPSYLTLPLIDPSDFFSQTSTQSNQLRVHEIRKHRHKRANHMKSDDNINPSVSNSWGFSSSESDRSADITEWPTAPKQKPVQENVVLPNPNQSGLLKDIGGIGVGFNVGVGVPGNDPVAVGARVGVGLGESGLAGKLPIGENIFPRQGEHQSLNDYDGNKYYIIPDKASKYLQAIRSGQLNIPHYAPEKTLIGINGGVGIGGR